MKWCILFLAGLTLAAAAGCSKGPPAGPNLARPYPVRGTITFPGKAPLRGGVVYFTPTEVRSGRKVRYEGAGLVDASGRYKVGLNGDERGLAAGEYRVTVQPREVQELPASNSRQIPRRFREQAQTPWTVTVAEKDNRFDFEIR